MKKLLCYAGIHKWEKSVLIGWNPNIKHEGERVSFPPVLFCERCKRVRTKQGTMDAKKYVRLSLDVRLETAFPCLGNNYARP